MSRLGIIQEQEPECCEMCGKIDECRPYGPNGENICFDCAMTKCDPKQVEKRMAQHILEKQMPTQRELEEMQMDYLQMDRDKVRDICHEIMKDELFEGMVAKEELRLLKEGSTIVVPKDVEHARSMFKMACFYLSQYDKDFKLKMEL